MSRDAKFDNIKAKALLFSSVRSLLSILVNLPNSILSRKLNVIKRRTRPKMRNKKKYLGRFRS